MNDPSTHKLPSLVTVSQSESVSPLYSLCFLLHVLYMLPQKRLHSKLRTAEKMKKLSETV